MKHNDAKALVFAMFGSTEHSSRGVKKMNSPEVQKAYNDAFGDYPNAYGIDGHWAERLREVVEALENACSECGGSGTIVGTCGIAMEIEAGEVREVSTGEFQCSKCKGLGYVGTTADSLPTQTDFMEYASVNVKCCVCGAESGFSSPDGRHVNAWDCGEHTLVDRMKALLLEFGVKDKQDYVKACLTLDYDCELLFVQVSKKIWKTA